MTLTQNEPAAEQDEAEYVGIGPTQEHRQADAAMQELLDDLESSSLLRLAGYFTDHAIDWGSTHQEYADARGHLVGLMLHHGWVPPVLHHEPLPAPDAADWADIQAWVLAMAFRAKAGVKGGMTDTEELAWVQIAEQAIALATKHDNNNN